MLITIVFEGDEQRGLALRIPEDAKLADLRKELQRQAKLEADEYFRFGGHNLDVSAEAETTAKEIMGDSNVIHIQPRAKSVVVTEQAYTLLRASDQKRRMLKLKPDLTLADLRTQLGSWISADDTFSGEDGSVIEIGEEGSWRIADLAEAGGTLVVGTAKSITPPVEKEPKTPRDPVKPNLPDTDPSTITWGLESGGTPPDMLDNLMQTIGDAEVEEPSAFSLLSLKQVKAVFTALYLNRGLRFGTQEARLAWAERSPMAPVSYEPTGDNVHAGGSASAAEWTTSATASRILHELRERTVHVANASGGYEGFGLASQFRQELETLRRNEITTIHLLDELSVPKVVLFLDQDADLTASPALIQAVQKALSGKPDRAAQYRALHRDVFDRFGYFFPCEVVLGGRWTRSLQVSSESQEQQEQLLRAFSFSLAADVQTDKGRFTGDVGYGNRSEQFENNTTIQQLRQQAIRIVGGSTAKGMADGGLAAWVGSVARVRFWAVIENRKLRPITRFLPQALADQCHSLIDEFALSAITKEYTVLDMREYVASANAELLGQLL
ncbi:MAC/perforin domain-containing protein [Chitinimonas sp. BJYL2]|uniref:MAC/perforin domain-containing protein n=1 Tax=Chitinimonas sp. BJYL2 TaxID=2976696 RepID=UPI0022B38B9A|nr:MAC/perforin domain-containing protein [Chitinimonas sp. BJYL2]